MTTQEQDFLKELHALFTKYGVRITRDRVYYPGDPETHYFAVRGGISVITIDDVAEKHGGVQSV